MNRGAGRTLLPGLAALAAGAVVAVVLLVARGFAWQTAVVVGLAAGVLVYATWQSVERLAPLYRRRRPPGDE
jgi:hypothetical protein